MKFTQLVYRHIFMEPKSLSTRYSVLLCMVTTYSTLCTYIVPMEQSTQESMRVVAHSEIYIPCVTMMYLKTSM